MANKKTINTCSVCPKTIECIRTNILKGIPYPGYYPDNCECGKSYISHPINRKDICRNNCPDYNREGENNEFDVSNCGEMVA